MNAGRVGWVQTEQLLCVSMPWFTDYVLSSCIWLVQWCDLPFLSSPWQEAFTKAAGKKSKTSVELDLGDMLAALEKHQQAMKARQLTNTKPLSFTGIHKLSQILTSSIKINLAIQQPYSKFQQ